MKIARCTLHREPLHREPRSACSRSSGRVRTAKEESFRGVDFKIWGIVFPIPSVLSFLPCLLFSMVCLFGVGIWSRPLFVALRLPIGLQPCACVLSSSPSVLQCDFFSSAGSKNLVLCPEDREPEHWLDPPMHRMQREQLLQQGF